MRVMTYNIWNGGSDDAGDRTARILEVIAEAAPDVLAMQECDGFAEGDRALLRRFEAELGMGGELALAQETGHHVALLTRGFEHRAVHVLHEDFHHAALHVELARDGERLSVLVAHLSPFDAAERLREAVRLVAQLPADHDCLLMGDLNALSPRDLGRYNVGAWPEHYRERHRSAAAELDTRAVEALEAAGLVDLAAQAGAGDDTRPTPLLPGRPAQRLDYVFASAGLAARISSARVERSAAALTASDHMPVVVDVAD